MAGRRPGPKPLIVQASGELRLCGRPWYPAPLSSGRTARRRRAGNPHHGREIESHPQRRARGRASCPEDPGVTGTPRALARRYARALLDVADRQGPNATLALRDELRAFAPIVAGHPELRRALLHPGLGSEAKTAPARRGRRSGRGLDPPAAAPRPPRRARPRGPPPGRRRGLRRARERRAGHRVGRGRLGGGPARRRSAGPSPPPSATPSSCGPGSSPHVLGGLLVRVGGRTYDGTVRTRLDALRQRLAAAGPGPSARAS